MQRSSRILLCGAAFSTVLLFCAGCRRHSKDVAPDYAALRLERSQNLSRPDGLLSIVATQSLGDGDSSIGSAKDNVVVAEHLPPHFGMVRVVDGKASLIQNEERMQKSKTVAAGAQLPVVSGSDLQNSDAKQYVHAGGLFFAAVKGKTHTYLLVKDPHASGVNHFGGLTWYPLSSKWRVPAHWVPYVTPHSLTVGMRGGQVIQDLAVGYAEFTVEGQMQRLVATEDDGHLFFVIGDATNKTETYGGGRFIENAVPDHGMHQEGTVMLDFNELTNPYCAYANFENCPRPTQENTLQVAITAGEKRFAE